MPGAAHCESDGDANALLNDRGLHVPPNPNQCCAANEKFRNEQKHTSYKNMHNDNQFGVLRESQRYLNSVSGTRFPSRTTKTSGMLCRVSASDRAPIHQSHLRTRNDSASRAPMISAQRAPAAQRRAQTSTTRGRPHRSAASRTSNSPPIRDGDRMDRRDCRMPNHARAAAIALMREAVGLP
jgi:hypothetical protein